MDILVSDIEDCSELNCRGEINPVDVMPLVKNIKKNGLLQPVVVREFLDGDYDTDKKYQLVAGFRRLTAYKVLGTEKIPARLVTISFRESSFINLSENIQRKELNIIQEARAVQHLLDKGYSRQDIADELDMGDGWVQIRTMLLTLPHDIQMEAAAGVINQWQIREIAALPTKAEQYNAVRLIKTMTERGKKLDRDEMRLHTKPEGEVKKLRDKKEIISMITHIVYGVGPGLFTRTLAWAGGEISNEELYTNISDHAKEIGIEYLAPGKS